MALVIRYLSQPHAGEEIAVSDEVSEVRFGRALNAEIGFPAELDVVGRDHFRLRRELGGYRFVISRDHPVYAGGRAVMDGEELDQSTEIQLAGPTGPRLRVERVAAAAANMPKTQVLRGGQDIADFATATATGHRRLGRWLGVVAVVVAAVAGGYLLLHQDISDVQAELPSLTSQFAKVNEAAAARVDAAAIIARNKESVYSIQLQTPTGAVVSGGTGSVVRLPDGTKAIATNAHVADLFLQTRPGGQYPGMKVMAVQPKGPDYPQIAVTGAKLHPGYLPLMAAMERITRMAMAGAARPVLPMLGFDVALIYVAEPEKLGEPLTYASRETIKALKAGDPLVLIGFGAEGVRGTDERRPEPTSQTGIITSMTTFFLSTGGAEDNLLVQHSVPAVGGASGSPMFNAKGEVVALINAVNVADTASSGERIVSAALVNYAQRADLLLDLAEGAAEGKMPGYLEQIAEAEKQVAKSEAEIFAGLAADLGMLAGDQSRVKQVAVLDAVMDRKFSDSPTALYALGTLNISPGQIYLVAAVAEDRRRIVVVALDAAGNAISAGANTSYVSFLAVDNRETKLPQLTYMIADLASFEAAPAQAGKIKIVIYQAEPKAGGS